MDGTVLFGPVAAAPIKLLQQFAHPANGAGLAAVAALEIEARRQDLRSFG
jgi:hypothetical protein